MSHPPDFSTHGTIVWNDPTRRAIFHAWFEPLTSSHHLLPATLRPASADASFRRYFRVDSTAGVSFIVMDAPPDKENCRPFVTVQALMQAAGIRVPQIVDWNEAGGWMLLTDLGQQTALETLDANQPQAAHTRYMQAVDILLDWQRASRLGVLPAYDAALLQRELQLFPDWYLARHRQYILKPAQQAVLERCFGLLIADNLSAPQVFVHRDFMLRNMVVGNDGGLGLLDFQDAVYGPVTYDIASLLRDAFISWEEDFVLDITVRYWEKARRAGILGSSAFGSDFGDFYRAVDWMALQRHLKVAGIFARLTLRDGKPRYLADTPRFIRYIRRTAGRYRELTPLLRLVDEAEGMHEAVAYAFGRV